MSEGHLLQTLRKAESLDDEPSTYARLLESAGHLLSEASALEELKVAVLLKDRAARPTALRSLIPRIPERERLNVSRKALEATLSLENDMHRGTCLKIRRTRSSRCVNHKRRFYFLDCRRNGTRKTQQKTAQEGTIKRGLNTIRAALNHAVENTAKFPDLVNYNVPKNPLTKKVEEERDRVLTDEEIGAICEALSTRPEWYEALFFFQLDLITGARMAELIRMRWEESSSRFGTVNLYSSKTRKWRTIKAPAAATLLANRKAAGLSGTDLVLTHPDHWYRKAFKRASQSIGISYGQKTPGGWSVHDLRHRCLTNLAIAGIPINGIKEYAGHASIVETQKYLRFMSQSVELAASISHHLAQLSKAQVATPPEQPLRLVKKTNRS